MAAKKSYPTPNVHGSGIFSRFQAVPGRILTRLRSYSQVLPNPPKTLTLGETKARNGFSTLKIGGYHVSSPGDPLLLTRRPPGGVPRHVRVHAGLGYGYRMPAHARTLPGTCPRGLSVNKGGSQGLKTWYPPILRVLNPVPALVSPSSKVLWVFGAENLKI